MSPDAVTPLRHRMIEGMNARKLCAGTQRGHIHSCKRFAVAGGQCTGPVGVLFASWTTASLIRRQTATPL
jgi:hypothetical protein